MLLVLQVSGESADHTAELGGEEGRVEGGELVVELETSVRWHCGLATLISVRPKSICGVHPFEKLEAVEAVVPLGLRRGRFKAPDSLIASLFEIREGHAAERTKAGLDSAREEGRIGGRRPKLSDRQQSEIRKMITRGDKTAADAARLFKVHPATVSRLLARASLRMVNRAK